MNAIHHLPAGLRVRLLGILVLVGSLLAFVFSSNTLKATTQPTPTVQFVDVTTSAHLNWNLKQLAPGAKYLIETMGGGGGFLDYNGDGLLDIYFVCYSQTPQPAGASKLRDVLYRNNGDGTFTDVTEAAGIDNSMQGMGLAIGDYN